MSRRSPFKRHRFPPEIILLAVRWYCRYALSYRDVRDMLAERGIKVDGSTIYRWVVKFGPEISKRNFSHRDRRGQTWHVDETYIRVGGKWRYLWRAVDQHGKLIDFRLTARRDAKAARAFLRKAMDNARLYQPLVIITDKAHSYRKVLAKFNRHRDPGDQIRHVDRKYLNNRIEGGHSALNKLLNPMRGFKTLRSAKATLQGIETIRTIKNNHIHQRRSGPIGEIEHLHKLFGLAA